MTLIALVTAAAMIASPVPQEGLAGVSCDRLAESLAAFHQETLRLERYRVAEGHAPNQFLPDTTRRMQAVERYMAARDLRPREAAPTERALFRSTGAQMMTEFERRCRA